MRENGRSEHQYSTVEMAPGELDENRTRTSETRSTAVTGATGARELLAR
jgi:hypothetical protein